MKTFDDISDPLHQRLAEGLARLGAVARQLDWQTAEAEGLSPTQADILHFVARRLEGVGLSAVAAHVAVRSATASDAVTALERKDLIRKHPDPEDGRAVILKATAKGRALALRWPQSFGAVVSGLDTAEQAALFGLVVKMIRNLQREHLIAPQRTCVTCRYFRENVTPGSDTPHHCALVDAPMAERHLRIDCPEHDLISA